MAFATIDMTKGITGSVPTANLPTIPVTKGGTGLTAGTTDQILKFTGTTTLASAAISTGKVLQVVEGVKISESYTTSTSYVDTGLSQAITVQVLVIKFYV